jgi:uncharacterized protein YbjT (DUF2867 family)
MGEGRVMTRILILGANGQLARHTTPFFLNRTDIHLTLFLRNARRLKNPDLARATIVQGDVTDRQALKAMMVAQNAVYANLSGDMATQARAVVDAMNMSGLKRLIFVSSMGIYGEVPGEKYRSVLDPYRDSAAIVEASDLDYTILRPGWFTQGTGTHFEITQKGEPFRGHDVSLDSLSTLIVQLALSPSLHARCSLGVSSSSLSTVISEK